MSTFLALFAFFTNYFGRNTTIQVVSYTAEDHIIKTIDGYVVEKRVETVTVSTKGFAYQPKQLYVRSKGHHFLQGNEYAHLTEAQRRAEDSNTFAFTACGSRFWREATAEEAAAVGLQLTITNQIKATNQVTLDVSRFHIVERERMTTQEEVAIYEKAKAEHARFYRANGYTAL